jgi:hypothetical protein
MELNYSKVPKLTGEDAKKRFNKIYKTLDSTTWPLYLVGPSGSGKSIMAMNVAKYYAKKKNVKAYYVQLSPDQTKTSLILGLRLQGGSLVPKRGIIAQAMDEGAIIVVDETPHASQELLLMFNSICDRTSVTAIGDDSVIAKDTFRVIFAGNTSNYAANNKLPQSFAQRMIAFNFDYPSIEDEVQIAYKMYCEEYNGDKEVPQLVCQYITSILREVRNEKFPLSVRNIAAALMLLNSCDTKETVTEEQVNELVNEIGGDNVESFAKKCYQALHNSAPTNINVIKDDKDLFELFGFITKVGQQEFVDAILSASMAYLDIEGFDFDIDETKARLRASIF